MVFFDSNVLVYITTKQDDRKHDVAVKLVGSTLHDKSGVISLQILREVANVLFMKSTDSPEFIAETLHGFDVLPCVPETRGMLDAAISLKLRYGLQLYDALVVAAAKSAGCDTVYSEDMGDGQIYDGVKVINPFAHLAQMPCREPNSIGT